MQPVVHEYRHVVLLEPHAGEVLRDVPHVVVTPRQLPLLSDVVDAYEHSPPRAAVAVHDPHGGVDVDETRRAELGVLLVAHGGQVSSHCEENSRADPREREREVVREPQT